jgi:hypothetical protein
MMGEERVSPWIDLNEPSLWDGRLASIYLLVLTNLFIVPAFLLAAFRGSRTTAVILLGVYINSCLYHSCRGGIVCFMRFDQSRTLDYLAVYTAMVWFIYMIGARRHDGTLDERRHTELHFATMILLGIAIVGEFSSTWLPIVGIGLPLVVVLALDFLEPRTLVYRSGWAWATLVCFLVAGVAFAIAPPGAYWWAHSLWHVIVMIGILFFMLALSPYTRATVKCHNCHQPQLRL